MPFERDLEPDRGWVEIRQRPPVHRHRPVSQFGMESRVFEPQELSQVVGPGRPQIRLGGRQRPTLLLGLIPETFVYLPNGLPVRPPISPIRRLPHGLVAVIDIAPVADEWQ